MQNREAPSVNSAENNSAIKNESPWQKMAEEVPPFRGDKKQFIDTTETIDFSTNQGKFKWLENYVDKELDLLADREYDIIAENNLLGEKKKDREEVLESNKEYQGIKKDIDRLKRESKILEGLDIDDDNSILDVLGQRVISLQEIVNKTSGEVFQSVSLDRDATWRLYEILSREMARNDPKYFSKKEMGTILKSEVAQAEKQVEKTMVDGILGKDCLYIASNGEKMPGADTGDAEIDLRAARQDVKTFELLMSDFETVNGDLPVAIKREDFAPIINRFIDDHTSQINQVKAKSRTLAKDTPEYIKNDVERRRLVSERLSAKRLLDKYFNVSQTEPTSESNTEE